MRSRRDKESAMIDPDDDPESDRLAYVRQLVSARCCQEVSADEVAEAFALPGNDDDSGIPPRIAEQILLVLDRMADRMDALEAGARLN
jgi:hypothetical protein